VTSEESCDKSMIAVMALGVMGVAGTVVAAERVSVGYTDGIPSTTSKDLQIQTSTSRKDTFDSFCL